jgi:type VI secretion system protein ImpA
MPSPSVLDLDELIAPIPGDSPAGGSVPFAVREKLEEYRKEVDPNDFDANDPMRPESAQKADWAAVVRLTRETLTETSKDLLVAARLTEGLTKAHGFGGLRDGLRLMRRLVSECWDRLNPAIESEDDLEVRAAPFYWIDEADRGARFPNTLRQVPMVWGEGGRFGWLQWKQSQGGKDGISPADIEKAIEATPRELCQATVEDLTESWQELDTLAKELNGKMGQYAPAFTGLRQAVGECRALAQQILQRKGPDLSQPEEQAGGGEAGDGGAVGAGPADRGGSFLGKQVNSRAQVYQQLAQTAALLQRLEPHSPIPYLINRAVELGALSFPELMKQLIRDSDVLTSMNRELGIKEPSEE